MKNFLTLLFFLFLISCSKTKKNDSKTTIIDKQSAENINLSTPACLLPQLQAGAAAEKSETDYPNYTFKETDLDCTILILEKELLKKGYQPPSPEKFAQKVFEIFGRKINYSMSTKFVYIDANDTCQKSIVYNRNSDDGMVPRSYYLVKDNRFITELFAIPEIIDYSKAFPESKNLENQVPQTQGDVKITKWNEDKNLSKKRSENINTTIARNKYLFNDSKADFSWLKINDKDFLYMLIKKFGYVKDKDLVHFVLQNNYKDIVQFEKIIFSTKCNNDIVLNREVMDIIANLPSEDKTKYLYSISDLIVQEIKSNNSGFNNSFSKKTEMLGKLAYYSTKIGEKSNMYYAFFSIIGSVEGGKAYEEEFRKNNYYNISDFKKIWEETRTGGVSYPGME